MAETELIAAYLADLRTLVCGRSAFSPRLWFGTDRLLAEANDHLCEATEHGLASGLDAAEAQRQAIARFGSARDVACRFAEQRLATALPRALVASGFGLVAMLACGALESLFPVPALFHWEEAQPGVDRILVTGNICQAAALLLLPVCFLLLRQGRLRLAAHAANALGIGMLFGAVAPGFGRMMLHLAQQGASSHAPLYLRLAVGLLAYAAIFPAVSINDALSAVRRA